MAADVGVEAEMDPESFAGSSEKTKPGVKTSVSVPDATLKPMMAPSWDAATRAHYGVEGVRGLVGLGRGER